MEPLRVQRGRKEVMFGEKPDGAAGVERCCIIVYLCIYRAEVCVHAGEGASQVFMCKKKKVLERRLQPQQHFLSLQGETKVRQKSVLDFFFLSFFLQRSGNSGQVRRRCFLRID